MLYLYLDESGDLGFDFVEKKPTSFFIVTILAIYGMQEHRHITKCVKSTLRRKSGRKKLHELKGSLTPLPIKEYLFKKMRDTHFNIYSVILDKRQAYARMWYEKERAYNFIAHSVLKKVFIGKDIPMINLDTTWYNVFKEKISYEEIIAL